ncbi:MAG: cell division protein FtsZ [Bryobacteraceae bacterium]|nr:cell division protein FtsZ [Bryobacterales bacterium]MEB2360919.1 cell division protein FtsZ [Bryobacterales bacterium]NUN00334.1 cell division protein FtsZ [Bryobacteraceae bacterium]
MEDKGLDALKFEIQEEALLGTRTKVVGVGGGGSNAVARMMAEGMSGVDFYVLNTDRQALMASPVPNKLAIGTKLTNGLGTGSDPNIGREAALEDTGRIIEILEGADMVFITAGLGGGTGTGAAPVVASLAKELNALTVAVVTKPFSFEGPRRMKQANAGLSELASMVDTVIQIPNDRLLELAPRGTSVADAFRNADDVLRQAVQGISDIITVPGLINRDFSDIRTIMVGMGFAMMGTASAKGENAAVEAARLAINSPLLEEGGVRGARAMLVNITGSSQLTLHDVNEACMLIRAAAEYDEVHLSFGIVMNEAMQDSVKITVIATGFEREGLPTIARRAKDLAAADPLASAASAPEPVFVESVSEEAAVVAQREEQQEFFTPESEPADELDVPAFLRKERRMVQ